MRIMIVTDAWFPQTNGVVSTLAQTATWLGRFGHEVRMITPRDFRSVACPTYPEIRLSLLPYKKVKRHISAFSPQAVHIATEGPLGLSARRFCLKSGLPFTTSYHTQFPQYLRARFPIPLGASYRALRWFHGAAARCMVSTASVRQDLAAHGFENLATWRRGVDTEMFKPYPKDSLTLPRPIAAYVGRVAVEKQYPHATFIGYRFGEDLAKNLAAADIMVFPSRTDTFGLVNLEAMACGIPVAAYPVTGPIDVVEDGVTGALDLDLAVAARRALDIDPKACRERALKSGWDVCSREFESNLERCELPPQPKLILASRLVRESALDNASSSSIRPSRTRL